MWIVKLDWKSECYNSNWTKIFKKKKNAEYLFRKHIVEEYNKWSNVKAKETDDTDNLLEAVLLIIEESNNNGYDYEFDINMEVLKTED